MLGIVGIYFDVIQASQTPTGPFGLLSILTWGFILFTAVSISIIAQLWWHIHQIENSYTYALSLDGFDAFHGPTGNYLSVKMSNITDKPVQYQIDPTDIFIRVGGKCLPQPEGLPKTGGIISKSNPFDFILPYEIKPILQAGEASLHFESIYGPPGKFLFRQIRELHLRLNASSANKIRISYTQSLSETKPFKKEGSHK